MDSSTKDSLSKRYYFQDVKPTDDYEQFWIRYKPERVLRTRLNEKHKGAGILMGAVSVMLATLYFFYGVSGPFLLVVAFCTLLVIIKLHYMLYPTHITLTDSGMQLHWLRSFCNIAGTAINWDRLTHVSITHSKHVFGNESCLEFNVIASGLSFKQRLAYILMAPELSSGWLRGDRCKLMMKLDGIASSDDKKRLQIALKRFLPTYRIEPAVSEELNLGMRVQTYTDLWFDALSSSTKRLREETLPTGARIFEGRYEVVCEIGAGGQAVVYEAIDRRNAQPTDKVKKVVLKEFVLPAHAGANVRKRVLEHIQSEAELLKTLKHPNIVKLVDFFVEDQRAYLVLERIIGPTLKQLVQDNGPVSPHRAIFFGLQMCEILGYLHTHNVVHRDFTPDNLIFGYGDILKLIDFNVAQQLEADSTKSVVGKHSYIPPEQFRGKATIQSDLYAFGGTLHFLLTGSQPEAISISHPRELVPELNEELDRIVARATEIDTNLRYQDVIELRQDLERLKQSLPEPEPS